MSRAWGVWTKLKLEVLSEYLDKFVTASQRAPNTVYLDLFAGQVENTLRDTQLPIDGSAARALQAKLPFSRVVLFERLPGQPPSSRGSSNVSRTERPRSECGRVTATTASTTRSPT
jgi:hypothetical protein